MSTCCEASASSDSPYTIGQMITLRGVFTKKADGTAVNPGTVRLNIKKPDGTLTTYQYPADISRDTDGDYYMDYAPDMSGMWSYYFWSTGNGQAADGGEFEVLGHAAAS